MWCKVHSFIHSFIQPHSLTSWTNEHIGWLPSQLQLVLYLFLFFLSLFLSFFPRKEGRLTYSLPAPVFSRYRSYHSCHHRKAGRAGAGARLGLGWVGLVLTSCTVPYHTARQPCHESHVLFCFCFLFLFLFFVFVSFSTSRTRLSWYLHARMLACMLLIPIASGHGRYKFYVTVSCLYWLIHRVATGAATCNDHDAT